MKKFWWLILLFAGFEARAGIEGHLIGQGYLSYNILNNSMGTLKFEGDFSFSGGGMIEFIVNRKVGLESGFVFMNRKFKIKQGSLSQGQAVNGYRVPSIARFYFSSNWAIGGGLYYDIVTTRGCFDTNNDYGYIGEIRFIPPLKIEKIRVLLALQYVHGTQTCNLFGGKTLRAVNLLFGLSYRFA